MGAGGRRWGEEGDRERREVKGKRGEGRVTIIIVNVAELFKFPGCSYYDNTLEYQCFSNTNC